MTRILSHDDLVQEIVGATDYIASTFPDNNPHEADDDDFLLAAQRITSESHVISIMGDRGVGKSTLLVNALKQLRESGQYIVLPPLSPELFGDKDTLLNIALAAVHQQYSSIVTSVDETARLELLRKLQAAKRSAAINAIPVSRLLSAASSITEFGRELQDMAGGTEQTWRDVQRLFTSLVSVSPKIRATIIAIDDADVMRAPAQLELVRQVRVLGSCNHVIPIVALREAEIARRLVREAREDLYPGLGLKADFDPSIEREAQDSVAPQVRKTFPHWSTFRIPDPTWHERRDYAPPNRTESIAALLLNVDPAEKTRLVLANNLLLSHADQTQGLIAAITDPLPPNLRKLAQIWTSLSLAAASGKEHSSPQIRALVINSLLGSIDVPFGTQASLSCKMTPQDAIAMPMRASIDFHGLYGAVRAGDWLDLDTKASSHYPTGSIVFDLRQIEKVVPRWRVSSSTVPDILDTTGAHSLALAIQGMILDYDDVQIESSSQFTFGTTFDSFTFVQSVSIFASATDDSFIQFPQSVTLASCVRTVNAWAAIVQRASDENLSLRHVLALSIQASIEIHMLSKDAEVDSYDTEYDEAFERASREAHAVIAESRAAHHQQAASQHFLAWYQYWLPAHWHSALFDQNEIRTLTARLLQVSGRSTGFEPPSRIYIDRSLSRRMRTYCEQVGSTESVEKHSWLGGYGAVVDDLEIKLPPTWERLILPAWKRLSTAPLMGNAALAERVPSKPDVTEREPEPKSNSEFDVEGDGELLVAYTVARIRAWAQR